MKVVRLFVAVVDPLRRALWCRWRHRWQPYYGGSVRTVCSACDGPEYSRPPAVTEEER